MSYLDKYIKSKKKGQKKPEKTKEKEIEADLSNILKMPLEQFSGERTALKCRGPDGVFWIVSDGMTARVQKVDGIYYTAYELRSLMQLEDQTTIVDVHKSKILFDGEIKEVKT